MDISKNFITVQGWMAQNLNLKGNNLLAFALIFGFCQDKESQFKGSLKYICEWLQCSRGTAMNALSFLVENDMIVKKVISKNLVTFNEYTISERVVQILNGGGTKIERGGGTKIEPNNIVLNNIEDNNTLNIKKEKSFKTFSIEDFQNEIKLNRGAANFSAQDCIDFHDYWTETDANGKMRFKREITWNTDKRMLRWKKNDRTQINGQKTSTKTTKEDVMNGGKDLLLKYAELERQKMGNK